MHPLDKSTLLTAIKMTIQVSIIVPCYNEENRIRFLLDAIYLQSYPREKLEVIIADGHSKDTTREVIAAFQLTHPDLKIHVLDNDAGTIPAALNTAIKASSGEYIIRMDAHSGPSPQYVQHAVDALQANQAENVGGVWEIRSGADTWVARSIAVAAAHPLGVGDALYRHTTEPAYVDTVPFGAFRKELINTIGYFDETLLANEDYEFNTRIRKNGGRVWLNPQLRSIYFARATLKALWQQYVRYGFWKFKMLQRYPTSLRWRQALPPVFVASLIISLFLSLFFHLFIWLIMAQLVIYFSILGLVALRLSVQKKQLFLILGFPLAVAVMHIAWGSGFIASIFDWSKQN